MRRTDQEFKAEVLRRSAAYRAERKNRAKKILTTTFCVLFVFTGFIVMQPLLYARGGSTEAAVMDGAVENREFNGIIAGEEDTMYAVEEPREEAREAAEPEMQSSMTGSSKADAQAVEGLWDLIPMVMIDGVLYLDTGYISDTQKRCGMMDGQITSQVSGSQQPTEDDQSNFGTGYSYQYGAEEGTVEILINGKWFIFATEEARENIHFSE